MCRCDQDCQRAGRPLHAAGDCDELSTVADHWPRTRRQLVTDGEDPNDPAHGRGLCEGCHNRHTARSSPGGWHT
ncbi:hypothetical protein C0R02_27625 [Streptomyces albidoflavus]|nr:hypothetical protein C0R02_27625 [Streptomyces albidoflavus]